MNPIHPALARLARAASHQDLGELEETLHVALRKPTWLRPEHRVGDPNGYMRHLLYIDPGDAFAITAGCDKQFATCKAKFANGINFRGFPYMAGNDTVVSYPNSKQVMDGGSRYGN